MWLLAVLIIPCYSANILGIFPNPGKSHHFLGEVILKKLAMKGHQITMLSKFPQEKRLENFEDIDLWEINNDESFIKSFGKTSIIVALLKYLEVSKNETETVFKNRGVQKLLQDNKKFDLILMDFSTNLAHLIFGHIYQAPIILLSPLGATALTDWIVGNPQPTYVPHFLRPYTGQMTLYERTVNTLFYALFPYVIKMNINKQEELLNKYFKNPPSVEKLCERIELIFSNAFYAFETVRATLPNIINIGGVHIGKSETLPKDLETYLNSSKNGIIYFSLGTNMKSTFLSKETISVLNKAFSKLEMNVLWKYEGDTMPNKPDNVKLMSWISQNDVLAHPNVKLFLTHGGRLSLIESIYHGVPVIGMPIFGDQQINIPRAVNQGYALQVDIEDLSEESLLRAIEEMMKNSKYKIEISRRSEMMKNRLVHPLDEAIFWIEHVLKYGHANHLKNAAVNIPWYQYFLLDVVVVLIVITVAPIVALCIVVKLSYRKLCELLSCNQNKMKQL